MKVNLKLVGRRRRPGEIWIEDLAAQYVATVGPGQTGVGHVFTREGMMEWLMEQVRGHGRHHRGKVEVQLGEVLRAMRHKGMIEKVEAGVYRVRGNGSAGASPRTPQRGVPTIDLA